MFHVGDWDLFFFPVSWELLVGQHRLWIAVCEFDDFSCTVLVMASPFFLFWRFWFVCWLVALVLFLLLDEDCNPGWGDCGRPLRLLCDLLKMVNWRLHFVHWRLDY